MKQIGFLFLFISLLLGGCQRDEVVTAEQSAVAVKEHLWMMKRVETTPVTKGVAEKSKLWNPGDTIRIKFLPGGAYTPVLEQKVKQYAAVWLQYACLYFEYVPATEEADVKVGFDFDARCISWAVTGTDCRAVPQDECSLNFFELGMYGEENDKAEILRGFGHVLGFGFEHRNPDSPIVFNARAQNYFKNVCMLTDQDIADLLTLYNSEQTHHTAYDEYSIMVLELPRIILNSPHTMISANMVLSARDKGFALELYPRPVIDSSIVTMITNQRNISFEYSRVDTSLENSDIVIDWGDGIRETNVFTHQYVDSKEYIIRFYGDSKAILYLNSSQNGLTYLDISKCTALEGLDCVSNQLENIDVSKNLELRILNLNINQISSIDVSKNLKLEGLVCCKNNLKKIDISHNKLLILLDCSFNEIEQLDFNNNNLLEGLFCSFNKIQSLDVSNCLLFDRIFCGNNDFVENDLLFMEFINTLPSRIGAKYPGRVNLFAIPQNIELIEIAAAKNWIITDQDFPEIVF